MSAQDELVTRITEEIIKRIAAGNKPEPGPAPAPAPSGLKPDLIVTGPQSDPLGRLPEAAAAAVKASFAIHPVNSFEAEGLPKVPLLIPCLPIQPLVRVASGDEGCTVEGRQLLCALLEGRTAVVWEDGIVWRRYEKTAPKSLVAIWRKCEQSLKEAGVKLVSSDFIVSALTGKSLSPSAPESHSSKSEPPPWSGAAQRGYGASEPERASRVLTEAKVMEMRPPGSGPGTLELCPGDILTPLAQDYLKSQKITIK